MLRVGGKFEEIGFDEAFNIIRYKIKSVKPDENAFFAGARLSNEEMFLVQKFARFAAKTNNISSFHYIERGTGYKYNTIANVPFDEIKKASRIYLIGSEINMDNAVVGFMINNAQYLKNTPVVQVTALEKTRMDHKVNKTLEIKDYYFFIKAVNYYLLSKGMENKLFINDNCLGFDDYKSKLLSEDFKVIMKKASCNEHDLIEFAEEYNNELNACNCIL